MCVCVCVRACMCVRACVCVRAGVLPVIMLFPTGHKILKFASKYF